MRNRKMVKITAIRDNELSRVNDRKYSLQGTKARLDNGESISVLVKAELNGFKKFREVEAFRLELLDINRGKQLVTLKFNAQQSFTLPFNSIKSGLVYVDRLENELEKILIVVDDINTQKEMIKTSERLRQLEMQCDKLAEERVSLFRNMELVDQDRLENIEKNKQLESKNKELNKTLLRKELELKEVKNQLVVAKETVHESQCGDFNSKLIETLSKINGDDLEFLVSICNNEKDSLEQKSKYINRILSK